MIRTQQDVDSCLQNTSLWAACWDPEFTPYPATYLRRGQWESPPPGHNGKRRGTAGPSPDEIREAVAKYGAEATRKWLEGMHADTAVVEQYVSDGLGV